MSDLSIRPFLDDLRSRRRGLNRYLRKRLDPNQRYGLRVTLFAIGLGLLGIPFALLVIGVTQQTGLVRWDKSAAEWFFELKVGAPWLSGVLNGISFLGFPPWFWFLAGSTAVYLGIKHRYRLVAYLLTTAIGGSVVNTIVKTAVNRDRPTFKDPAAITFQSGKSFPSGHSMSSTVVYGALLLIFLPVIPRKYRPVAIAATMGLVLLIGASRLALGVHFISDVMGGIVLGLAWLAASTAAFSAWRVDEGKNPVEPSKGMEPEAASDLKL